MHKTLHHVPKILTTKLIKHKSVKGTRVVQRETLETFNYRRAFYTTTAIILLIAVGIGYGIFAAMNIGLTKEEAKSNLLSQFNNSDEVGDILDRKDVDPLTFVFNKDLDNNKVYTFTGTRNSLLEHDITSNVYRVKDTTPTNVPTTVKRAYSREDIEANYVKSVDGVELSGLKTGRERNPNTYILKSNFNEQTVYAFTGTGIETQQHDVAPNVYHVEDNLPEFVPSTVQRAYSKRDIENSYVKKLEGNVLLGLKTKTEIDPHNYILKNTLDSNQVYTINEIETDTQLVDATNSLLYKNNSEGENLPENVNTRGYTKNEIEASYIRPIEVEDLEGLKTFSTLSPKVYTWDHEFNTDTAYVFSRTLITKKHHIISNNLYYVTDTRPTLIPSKAKRGYSKQDVKERYVLKSGQLNLNGINAPYERTELSNAHVYSFSWDGIEKAKKPHEITDKVHYVGEVKPENIPSTVTRAYTTAEIETNYVLKLDNKNIDGVNASKEVDPKTYIKKNTLTNNAYYQSSGKSGNLSVDLLSINKGEIYQATKQLNNNESIALELFDFENKRYINGDSDEGLYVLDNTNPFISVLEPTNHIEEESYEIASEGSDGNFRMVDSEVLALDNKISLFQKEKLTNHVDRYGNKNWWSGWKWKSESYDSSSNLTTCYGEEITYASLLNVANKSLPYGAALTDKDITYILKNLGKYKLRIFFGSGYPYLIHSFSILHNGDGTEWDGVKETSGEILPAEFPSIARATREKWDWEIYASPKAQSFHINYNWDGGVQNPFLCDLLRGDTWIAAIRGIEIYIDPFYT